jgi:hypothetical protein
MNGKACLPARPQNAANSQFQRARQSCGHAAAVQPGSIDEGTFMPCASNVPSIDNARIANVPIPKAKSVEILGSNKAQFRSGFALSLFVKGVNAHKSAAASHNHGDNLAWVG